LHLLLQNKGRTGGVDEELLAGELKQSCTNVMLQCFDPESRLIYVLGVIFAADSKLCGEILGITPEAYRKRLSRLRQQMAEFLREYCGLAGSEKCDCKKRVGYAIQTHRLRPSHLEYASLAQAEEYIQAMEGMDTWSLLFAELPRYRSPQAVRDFLHNIVSSERMATIRQAHA
jgi:DNA-directed RNA polymerase specialized sigma24 family protein